MTHEVGTNLGGILTPADLRKRCHVTAEGCWRYRQGEHKASTAPSIWFPPLGDRVSAGILACWWTHGRRPLKGEMWHVTCSTRHCANPEHRICGNRSTQMLAAKITLTEQARLRLTAALRASSTLTDADVLDIRAAKRESLKSIADRHGISMGYACSIRSGARRPMAVAADVVVTVRKLKPTPPPPSIFSGMPIGRYFQADTAVARAYGLEAS